MPERLLTATELASLLHVSKLWVVDRAQADELPGYRVGASWRFDSHEVAVWLNRQSNNAAISAPTERRVLPPRRLEPREAPKVDLSRALPAVDVAEEFDVPVVAVKAWIQNGSLTGLHVGRQWLVDADSLDGWRRILARSGCLDLPRGRTRTESIGDAVAQELVSRRSGGMGLTVRSFRRHGGVVPTWAGVMGSP
ncbi:MAG: helix-turn-helix domain-containing protein [Actinobacteria bacterium]|nr:helix-turn-helix domain-containing protein [Actinomycetota bacterium]MCG2801282.1 helix-turn-helix domain-containing protein [Cellulomonas sp.]